MSSGDQTADRELWDVLGCKWTVRVLRLLDRGDRHFNQIEREIDGLPASTLSDRLDRLQDLNLVDRTVQDTTPPTVMYSLTEKGSELIDILAQIDALERRYDD